MNGKTPIEILKCYKAIYHPAFGAMPVVILDYLSLFIKDLFDISIIPWDTLYKKLPVNETIAQYKYLEKISILRNNFFLPFKQKHRFISNAIQKAVRHRYYKQRKKSRNYHPTNYGMSHR